MLFGDAKASVDAIPEGSVTLTASAEAVTLY